MFKLEKLKSIFSKPTSENQISTLPENNSNSSEFTINNNNTTNIQDNNLNVENSKNIDNQTNNKSSNKNESLFEKEFNKQKRNKNWIKNIESNMDNESKPIKNNPIQGKNDNEIYNKDYKYNGEAIHFSCTQCGKCCNTPPKVEFEELFKLKDDFIFQTNHTCFLSYNKNPLPTEILDYYNGIGHTIVLTDLEAVMFYFIEFTPMINPSYKQCSKLIDNKCSIYEKRPHSCELYPFSKSYEQDQQWRSIEFFRMKTEEGIFKCDFSKNSPIIYENNMFQDYGIENRFEESISNIHNFTNHYINFLEKIGGKEHKNNHFKYLVSAISQKSLFISDTLNPMLTGVLNNLISKQDAELFVQSQINLIEKEINNSIHNKNKENLHTSRLYIKQKELFEKSLKIDMFDLSKYKFNELEKK